MMFTTTNQHSSPESRWLFVATAALLAAVSFFAAFYHRVALRNNAEQTIYDRRSLQLAIEKCNGLGNLCDLRANSVVYATVHNGNSALEGGYKLLPNHFKELERALQAGYRGLNMDIGKCGGQVKLVHGPCKLGTQSIEDVMANIVQFLSDNPHEVLILPSQITADVRLSEIDAAFQTVSGLKDLFYVHPGPSAEWPTLRELIEADTRILFFHYNGEQCAGNSDCPVGFHDWFRYAAETEFSFLTTHELKNKEKACQITRGGGGTRNFFGVNVFTTPPRLMSALLTNKERFLRNHVDSCSELNDGLDINLILVDFWGVGDVVAVVQALNAAL